MVARPVIAVSLALGAIGCGSSAERAVVTTPTTATQTASPPPSAAPATPPASPTAATVRGEVMGGPVVYVSDGDTIGVRLRGGVQRIRLLGIDAPETKDPDQPVACYGRRATARARTLMPRGARVTVVTDPTQDRVDKFGRLLAYVFPAGRPQPINERLVADGAARTYVYRRNRPPRRIGALRQAEAAAKAARRGLWGACPVR